MSGHSPAPGSEIGKPVLEPPRHEGEKLDKTLDRFKAFEQVMRDQNLGFLYERWRKHPCADPTRQSQWQNADEFGDQDIKILERFRGLDIGALDELANRLHNVGRSMDALASDSTNMGRTLDDNWKSGSSQKAVDKFTDLTKGARSYKKNIDDLSNNVEGVRQTAASIEKSLKNLLDATGKTLGKYGGMGVHSNTPDNLRGDLSGKIDRIDQALKYGLVKSLALVGNWHPNDTFDNAGTARDCLMPPSPELAHLIRSRSGFLDLDSSVSVFTNTWADEVCRELDDLCSRYYAAITKFRNTMDDLTRQADSALNRLNSSTEELDRDPFQKLVAPGDVPPGQNGKKGKQGTGPQNTDKPDQKSRDGSPPPSTGGQAGPMPHQPGTTPQQGGTPTTPAAPPTGDPGQSGGTPQTGGTPQVPSAGGTPTLPRTGQGNQSRRGTNLARLGGAGGDQAGLGQPGTSGQSAGEPETVSVTGPNGRNLKITSPDGQGHMKLTVDNGSGAPKTYDVDFGQSGAGSGAAAASRTAGQPGSGPAGTGDSGGGATQHVQADQHGHAVIHDGKDTITIDKGDGGQVKVTVDDGSGHPTSYTLDGGGDAQDAADSTSSLGAGAGTASMPDSGGAAVGGDTDRSIGAGTGGSLGDTGSSGASPVGAGAGGTISGNFGADTGGGGQAPDLGGTASPASIGGSAGIGAGAGAAGGFGAGGPDAGGLGPGGGGDGQMQPGAVSGADPGQVAGGAPGRAGQAAPAAAGGGGSDGGAGVLPPPIAGGGAGGGGGDRERGASMWRTEGNLFDDLDPTSLDELHDFLTGRGEE